MFVALFVTAAAILGMVDLPVAPEPVASKVPLHEIAHVKAITAFCAGFERHFNAATRPMLVADGNVSFLGYTMGGIESHFHSRGGELAIYDDRVHMMAYVGKLQKLVPVAQGEINELRLNAKLATVPADAAADLALASDLQAALDKQRQVTVDSLGVVQALTDYTLNSTRLNFEDLGAGLGSGAQAIAALGRPDPMGFLPGEDNESLRASPELQSQMPGSYDDYTVRTPSDRRDVRSYLHFDKQLDRIGDAEGAAAMKADALVERCR